MRGREMKKKGVVAVFCLGTTLVTTGCGGADGFNDLDALGNVAQGVGCLDCDGGVGDTADSMTLASTPMDLTQYQILAANSVFRCNDVVSWSDAMAELDFALSWNFITRDAYDWGVASGHYPVVSMVSSKVVAACRFQPRG